MLRILDCHGSGNHRAPVPTLCDKSLVTQDIHHELLECTSRVHGTETGLRGWVSGSEARKAGHDKMKGQGIVVSRLCERLYDFAGFEKGAWPACHKQER